MESNESDSPLMCVFFLKLKRHCDKRKPSGKGLSNDGQECQPMVYVQVMYVTMTSRTLCFEKDQRHVVTSKLFQQKISVLSIIG